MARLPALAALLLGACACAAPAAAQFTNAPRAATATDPYAPLGMRLGRFTLYPAVEITGTFTAGTLATPGAEIVISPELVAVFDISPHTLTLNVSADVIRVSTSSPGLVTAANANIDLALDLPGLWQLDLGAGYALTAQDALDPLTPGGLDRAPDIHTTTADATLAGPLGPLALRLSIGVERNAFEDGTISGVPVDQGDRTNTLFQGLARLSTDGGARFTPFVEAGFGRRIYDRPIGADTFEQGFRFVSLRGGFVYDSAPVLTAEIAAGAYREIPDDPALTGLRGFSFGITSNWSPREPVQVAFATQTTFNGDPSPTGGGSVRQDWSLRGTLAVRQNLSLGTTARYSTEWFSDGDIEHTAVAGADVAWQPTRWIRLNAGVTQQWLWSTDPSRNGASTVVQVTARVQR